MATRKEVMHNLVKEEAKNLKKNATEKELKYLNFETLNPNNLFNCIYGQIGGNCDSIRSIELQKKCCSRVYKRGGDLSDSKVNGSPKRLSRYSYWSPIEVFITQESNKENGNNERLVKYLKGETNRLNFK